MLSVCIINVSNATISNVLFYIIFYSCSVLITVKFKGFKKKVLYFGGVSATGKKRQLFIVTFLISQF